MALGTLGLRSNLRPYSEWLEDTASRKYVLLEFRPGKRITSWSLYSAGTYVAPFSYSYDGIKIDVVAVQSALDSGLTRVDSIAECQALAGSFFYEDPYALSSTAMWDDGLTRWDDGQTYWDRFTHLYIHLADGSNPADTTIEAFLGFFFGSAGETHPSLGTNKLTNGAFETWSDSVTPGTWTTSVSTGCTVTRDSSVVINGTYSARATMDGLRTGQSSSYIQTFSPITGGLYRFAGAYYTPVSNAPNVCAALRVRCSDGSGVQSDGRTTVASGFVQLDATAGNYRRFSFDFIAPASVADVRLQARTSDGLPGAGYVVFDDITLQRIYRYNYFDPRLSSSSIPESQMGSNDIYFGGKKVGTGSITLINGGLLESLFGDLDWINKEARVYVGGAFSDGEAVSFEDYRRPFTALSKTFSGNDKQVSITMQDLRDFFYVDLPLRTYELATYPDMDPSFTSKARPMWFGLKQNVTPVRISRSATTGYGTYELADCAKATSGIKAIDAVYAYLDATAASNKDTAKRLTLSAGTDYSTDLTNGQFTAVRDLTVIKIDATNDTVEWNDGSIRSVTLTQGLYLPATLASHIQTRMQTLTATAGCSYTNTTHLFAIGASGGTCNLLIASGTKKERSVFKTIGFTGTVDIAAGLGTSADTAVFTDADKQHILRVDGQGYKDDGSGTYTGSASALIETGADICRFLIVVFLGKPSSVIDTSSFAAARTRAPEPLAFYLKESVSARNIFDALERSTISDIVVDGSGMVYYSVYVSTVPSNITDFYDRDYIGFEVEKRADDVYTTVSVLYNQDPSSGVWQSVSSTEAATAVRHNRPERKDLQTYIRSRDGAQAVSDRTKELAKNPARIVKFSSKGKLVDKKVGDKIRLTRTRAIDSTGALSAAVMRIMNLKQNGIQGLSYVECIDDITTAAAGAS